MKLKNLLNEFNYTCTQGNLDVEVTDIIYNSKKVIPGCVFVCLIGSNVDGHKFAQKAVKNGAIAVLVSKEVKIDNCTVIQVNNTRYAMSCMSAAYFGHPASSLKTIGITGTKGKTTTSYMISSILEKAGIKTGIIGTLGVVYGKNRIQTCNTTPESYDIQYYLKKMKEDGCEVAILEASSLGLKWHRSSGFIYDYGIFTNFSHDHIEDNEHASLEEYKQCKGMLFKNCKTGIVNIDDALYKEILGVNTCKVETYSFIDENADTYATNDKLSAKENVLGVSFDLVKPSQYKVHVNIPGRFSAYNALAAIAVCTHFNVSSKNILDGLKDIRVKGRVEFIKTKGNYTLLIDYAHNALSMENILTTLRSYNPKRLVCLFGAGGNRPKDRRYEMGEICGKLADLSVITEDNSRYENVNDIIKDIKKGLSKTNGKSVEIPDRKEAIAYCIKNAQPGDIIILAGKGHETYKEINGIKHHFDEREAIKEIFKELNMED